MKVKICGISNEIDALAAIEEGADAIGFVMGGKVLPVEVEPYAQWVREIIKKFAVNVDSFLVTHLSGAEDILDLARYIKCTGIQISEYIPLEEMKKVRENFNGKIIKTIVSNEDCAFDRMKAYESYCDFFLMDSRNAGYTGGTGAENDWVRCAELINKTNVPVFIAGGLKTETVESAIKIAKPYGTDVSTGVSCFSDNYLKKDRKDRCRIAEFIRRSKQCLSVMEK